MIFSIDEEVIYELEQLKGYRATFIKVNKDIGNKIDKARITETVIYEDSSGAITIRNDTVRHWYVDKISPVVLVEGLKYDCIDLNEFDDIGWHSGQTVIGNLEADKIVVGDYLDRYKSDTIYSVKVKEIDLDEFKAVGRDRLSYFVTFSCIGNELKICSKDLRTIKSCYSTFEGCFGTGAIRFENNLLSKCEIISGMFLDSSVDKISLRGTQFESAKEIWTMFCKVKSLEVDLSNVDMRRVSIVHDMFYKCDIGVLNLSGIKLPKCLRISGRLFGHVDKLILNDTDLSDLTVICTEFRHCDDAYDNGHQNKDCICNVYMHDCKIKYTLLDKLSDIVTCRTLYTNMEHIYEWCRKSNVKCVYSGGRTVD